MMALFGQSSGPVEPFNLGLLAAKGSLFVTRPTVFSYTATVDELDQTAGELMDVFSKGAVKVEINQTYDLEDAASAHADLEARKTTGSSVLMP
jgi:NADPH2:quinone reductase